MTAQPVGRLPDQVRGTAPRTGVYVLLTFGWSWGWWLAAGLGGADVARLPAAWLFLVGGLGPLLAAVLLVSFERPRGSRGEFWRRVWDPRGVRPRWWLIAPAVGAGPTLVGWLSTRDLSMEIASSGTAGLGVVAWLVFAAGAAAVEEPGWRGYALDGLLVRHRPVQTALMLGTTWAVWHLPLFFLSGTYQQNLGIGTAPFWVFMTGMISQTFLYVWVVTGSGGSVLAAIVLHASTNLAGEMFDPSLRGELVALGLWVVAAVLLAIVWGRSARRDRP